MRLQVLWSRSSMCAAQRLLHTAWCGAAGALPVKQAHGAGRCYGAAAAGVVATEGPSRCKCCVTALSAHSLAWQLERLGGPASQQMNTETGMFPHANAAAVCGVVCMWREQGAAINLLHSVLQHGSEVFRCWRSVQCCVMVIEPRTSHGAACWVLCSAQAALDSWCMRLVIDLLLAEWAGGCALLRLPAIESACSDAQPCLCWAPGGGQTGSAHI